MRGGGRMKTIDIPKGVQIACGKELMTSRTMRDDAVCCGDENGYFCEGCQAWNDTNVLEEVG